MPAKPTPERGHNSFLTSAMHEDVGRVDAESIIDLADRGRAAPQGDGKDGSAEPCWPRARSTELKQDIADAKDEFYKDIAHSRPSPPRISRGCSVELDYLQGPGRHCETKLNIGAQHFLDYSAVEKDRKEQENKVLTAMEAELAVSTDAVRRHPRPAHR